MSKNKRMNQLNWICNEADLKKGKNECKLQLQHKNLQAIF